MKHTVQLSKEEIKEAFAQYLHIDMTQILTINIKNFLSQNSGTVEYEEKPKKGKL